MTVNLNLNQVAKDLLVSLLPDFLTKTVTRHGILKANYEFIFSSEECEDLSVSAIFKHENFDLSLRVKEDVLYGTITPKKDLIKRIGVKILDDLKETGEIDPNSPGVPSLTELICTAVRRAIYKQCLYVNQTSYGVEFSISVL